MRFLLDTNVVSEGVKPIPDARVANWLAGVDENTVYLSVMTLGEIGTASRGYRPERGGRGWMPGS